MSAATKVRSRATYDDRLDRAIARAGTSGVKVLATGRVKSTAQRFWIVSSVSDATHPHLCFQLASARISCDCRSGRARPGTPCQHVAAVVMHETVQADRRRRQAEELEAAEREEMAALVVQNARTLATLHDLNARMERDERQREAAPLYRDNKPFSIFR